MPDDAAWLDAVPGIARDERLGRHSQFGVGGPADWYLKVRDAAQLAGLVRRCRESAIAVTVVGAGSNTLILDGGIRGLVVRYDDRAVREDGESCVEMGAGCMLPRAALDCAARGLAGLEFGIGVPGTCGASVAGNAGAFGSEVKDVLVSCTALTPGGVTVQLTNADCAFTYRFSAFKAALREHIVLSARLQLRRDDPDEVRRRTDTIQEQRKATQPYGVRSLGSVFKNPPGDKAGRLVEAAGLKGRRHGGAQISPKHANFIVNVRQASASDVLALAELAQTEVERRFGVRLEREIVVVGEPGHVPAGTAA